MFRSTTAICLLLSATMIASTSTTIQRAGSAPTISAPSAASIAELWIDPGTMPRNLFEGPAGVAVKDRPGIDGRYEVVSKDTTGFSATYKVRDAAGPQVEREDRS